MNMVIGRGVIANRFIDYSLQSSHIIFAGSINDFAAIDDSEIQEEEDLVKKTLLESKDLIFVYFSTCGILDLAMATTPYVQHKTRMEKVIQDSGNKYLIFRLPQIMGLLNADSSLIGFLVDSIRNNRTIEIRQNAEINIIDIDDVHAITGRILSERKYINEIINIASPNNTPVLQIVREIEGLLSIKSSSQLINYGSNYDIDISTIKQIIVGLNIAFNECYIRRSLSKYFGHLISPPKLLSIIVPTYNEENGIEEFYRRTKSVMDLLRPRFEYEMIFVNDYSSDNTIYKLRKLAEKDLAVKVINFSRNFGNQIGITAGIDYSKGDLAVVIDDDLQDPPEIIPNFISRWDQGYKVVYGVRPKRQGVHPMFKVIAKLYYRVIGSLSETNIPNDTGDFRLIDRVVIDTLKSMREENRYYRGMVSWVGFRQTGVFYERDKRYAGVSTFSFKKYVNFALNGLTSFTDKPLYFSSLAGLVITMISFALMLMLVISKILDPSLSIRGWTSLTVIVLFFGGIQLLSIGILGIYVSKIYREVKGRPLYIVEETENMESLSEKDQ